MTVPPPNSPGNNDIGNNGPPAGTGPGLVAWNAMLARAESALRRHAYLDAQRQAEELLRAPVPRDVRGRALLVAGDAAYARRAYPYARQHYGAYVVEYPKAPEAARAGLAIGWARLRIGDRVGARAAWTELADARPTDPRTPQALLLAAELADQAGDSAAAERLLDRLVAQHPASPHVALARLNRSALLLRRNQETAALSDLGWVTRGAGPGVLDQRRQLDEALTNDGGEIALQTPSNAPAPADREPLERLAVVLLDPRHHERAPYLLHGVTLLAAQRGWASAQTAALATRLLEDFPSYPPAPALLRRVADAASAAEQWPLARRSWETLLARAPGAMGRAERLSLAEAQLHSGETARARQNLETTAAGGGNEGARALLLLAQAHAAGGDARAALAAYDRLQKEHPRFSRPAQSWLAQAKLLEDLGDHERARPVLQQAVAASGKSETVAEAAYHIAQGLSAERRHAEAVEWYMTASYVAPQSRWGRQALLGAGLSLTAQNDLRNALAAYWRLIAPRPDSDRADERELRGEAAYRAGEILRGASLHEEALEMFETSARLTAGLPGERRALLAALQCVKETGNRTAAENLNRRIEQLGARPAPPTPAPPVLGAASRTREAAAGSALPAAAR